jgi:hypothetical protein
MELSEAMAEIKRLEEDLEDENWGTLCSVANRLTEATGAPRGESLPEQIENGLLAVTRLREFERKIHGVGEGGIDITNGIPSEIYVAIGRGYYDDEDEDEYSLARDVAESVAARCQAEIARLRDNLETAEFLYARDNDIWTGLEKVQDDRIETLEAAARAVVDAWDEMKSELDIDDVARCLRELQVVMGDKREHKEP